MDVTLQAINVMMIIFIIVRHMKASDKKSSPKFFGQVPDPLLNQL